MWATDETKTETITLEHMFEKLIVSRKADTEWEGILNGDQNNTVENIA